MTTSSRPTEMPSQTSPAQAPRVLLLMGQSPAQARQYHNQSGHWALLAGNLRRSEVAARWITDDMNVLNPAFLQQIDVILNYTTGLDLPPEQESSLLAAVEGGAGYIGLHAATATFLNSAAHSRLIGARFYRHDPIKRFSIRFVDGQHPITRDLEEYEHEDELYELTGSLSDPKQMEPLRDVQVLAEAEGHPMVYVKQHGAGRVAYLASGHDGRSLAHPTYQMLFSRTLAWAARGH